MDYKESINKIITDNVKIASLHAEVTNTIYGLGGFSLGYGCFSTKSPQDFAALAFVFLLLLWGVSISKLNSAFEVLEAADHYAAKPIYLFKKCYPGLIGLVFLGAVASGFITTNGFNL